MILPIMISLKLSLRENDHQTFHKHQILFFSYFGSILSKNRLNLIDELDNSPLLSLFVVNFKNNLIFKFCFQLYFDIIPKIVFLIKCLTYLFIHFLLFFALKKSFMNILLHEGGC